MSDHKIKQRLNRAKKSATKILEQPAGDYTIIPLNSNVFHLEAIRKREIRVIRIVLDEIKKADIDLVRKLELPDLCTKEIWCKKENERGFVTEVVN
jgi:hypothetical protein